MKNSRTPKFRHHKATGQGFVELNGRRMYLGRFDLPETRRKYHRVIAEWLAHGNQIPPPADDITIVELIDLYVKHCEVYYRKADGTSTSELNAVKLALRGLNELYGDLRVVDFGPKSLTTLRNTWIARNITRKVINHFTANVRRAFKWATAEELIPVTVFQALQTVEGLRAGRSNAKESVPVMPVLESHIEAIKPFVGRYVWAAVQLQLLSGARPGEILKLRPIDFDTKAPVWTVNLLDHKTVHHGRRRVLCFGPRAIEIVKDLMQDCGVADYLISPIRAEQERHARASQHRRPNQKPDILKTDRHVGGCYTVISYCRAIHRACDQAGIPAWHPHQLRHNAASAARRVAGLDGAQVMLGHANAKITEVYAEVDQIKAIELAAQIG